MKNQMRAGVLIWQIAVLCTAAFVAGCEGDAKKASNPAYVNASLVKGGLLYDSWWKAATPSIAEPTAANPGYALTTGTQTSPTTGWRCKECHGWDYMGKLGAYATGSHATGVGGLLGHVPADPTDTEEQQEHFATIKNGVAGMAMSAFGPPLSDADIWNLVKFCHEGITNLDTYIDRATKTPKTASAAHGKTLFDGTCATSTCHGADGQAINFGSADEPEYLAHVAADNPWEFQHKVRFGQPGENMPSAITSGWSMQDVMDVLAHAQALPRD